MNKCDPTSQIYKSLLFGSDWYRYFQDMYGVDNVSWKINSFQDMLDHPTSLRNYTENEIEKILGNNWTKSSYGSKKDGWKFIENKHNDNMVFYHNGGGKHVGPYFGVKSGKTRTIKVVVDDTYKPLDGDKALAIKRIGNYYFNRN